MEPNPSEEQTVKNGTTIDTNENSWLGESTQCVLNTPHTLDVCELQGEGLICMLDTPRTVGMKRKICELEDEIILVKKKNAVKSQHIRRLKKRVADLEDMLVHVQGKNLVSEECRGLLDLSVPSAPKDLLKRQYCKATGAPLPTVYPPALRSFALTLHFYSPRAYSYVRKTFDTCLPHVRTISKWYRSVDCRPGFTSEALDTLKLKAEEVKKCGKKFVCALIIDEMAVRQHVEYDGVKYHGYVDIGNGLASDSLAVAREALVLMIVGVNHSLKLPVGYFLIDGLTGEERANIITNCITLLVDTGVEVMSLTCDGTSCNWAMARALGCRFDPAQMKTYFNNPVSGSLVAMFFDMCHMLKLQRNTLGDKVSMVDADGKMICWKFIEELHKLQNGEGLHAGNKLHSAHIEWKRRKMNVRLAAQTLSESVADAIEYFKDKGCIAFQGSEATIRYIRMVNRTFDIFNSRNILAKNWKSPISKFNIEETLNFLAIAETYFLSLKESSVGEFMWQSQRKTGFLGFVVGIHSLRLLLENFIEPTMNYADGVSIITKKSLKFLPTYKFSQDHLELFFGMVRQQGGWNNNPTARQFQSAYKKILIHNEITDTGTGNCQALDSTSILHVSTSSPCQVINDSTGQQSSITLETQIDEHDYSLIAAYTGQSKCSEEMVYHIAGFVSQKLEMELKCDTCTSVLRGPERLDSLTFKKSNGGLHFPGADVFDICKQCEKVFRLASQRMGGKKCPSAANVDILVTSVMQSYINKPIFVSLHQHMLDQDPMDNHVVHLLKAVARKYLKIKSFHTAKEFTKEIQTVRLRNVYTKLILFNGQ